jgi:subtilisin family serine protease
MEETTGRPEIVIGIIDGPVDGSHPDLQGATLSDVLAEAGGSSCRIPDSAACHHGTFVAGILGAQRGSPAPSISPGCSFITRPIFSEVLSAQVYPEVSPAELASAVVDTVDAGARIVNMSLGLATTALVSCRELEQAIEYAFQKGAILIAAAGNHGRIGPVPLFSHPWVVPVSACDEQGRLVVNSNTGISVGRRGLLAPGSTVLSTVGSSGYARMSGTSVAAPFVTGTAALLWSLFPQASAPEIRAALLLPGLSRKTIVPPLVNGVVSRDALAH